MALIPPADRPIRSLDFDLNWLFCTQCPNKLTSAWTCGSVFLFYFILFLLLFLRNPLFLSFYRLFLWQYRVNLSNHVTTLVIIRSLLSLNSSSQLLNLACSRGRSAHSCTFECSRVFTHAHCAAVKTREGREKAVGGRPQWRGGWVYLYTKMVYV